MLTPLPLLLLQEPELTAWRGASAFAAGDNYWQCVRTKRQYEEQGGGRRDRDR
jgi:actin-related protein